MLRNGHVHLFQQVSKTADVVFVAVGYNNAADFVGILFNVSKIGEHDVYTRHIAVREGKAAVHDEHIVCALEKGHILADFVKAAERNNAQRSLLHGFVVCSVKRQTCFGVNFGSGVLVLFSLVLLGLNLFLSGFLEKTLGLGFLSSRLFRSLLGVFLRGNLLAVSVSFGVVLCQFDTNLSIVNKYDYTISGRAL